MTCIVGLIDPEKNVWMGADSMTSFEDDVYISREPKIFQKENILIGSCGRSLLGDVIDCFEPPNDKWVKDLKFGPLKYIRTVFMPEFKDLLEKENILEEENNLKEIPNSELLIGYRGRLFRISTDLAVLENTLPYEAIGGGGPYALGSLYSTDLEEIYKTNPHARAMTALMAAEQFNAFVRRPFVVLCLKNNGGVLDAM